MKQVGNVEISQEAFLSVLDDSETDRRPTRCPGPLRRLRTEPLTQTWVPFPGAIALRDPDRTIRSAIQSLD